MQPGSGDVVVEVAGCGLCHTDIGFAYDGVPTRHPLPLVLGHEISGRVVDAGTHA
ncbi:MAG TPA: alcohol dehydrogenase catalytic domain-containing protein, partial [Thermoanaerobaculia bacterium]